MFNALTAGLSPPHTLKHKSCYDGNCVVTDSTLWQPMVPLVMTKLASWQPSCFSNREYREEPWINSRGAGSIKCYLCYQHVNFHFEETISFPTMQMCKLKIQLFDYEIMSFWILYISCDVLMCSFELIICYLWHHNWTIASCASKLINSHRISHLPPTCVVTSSQFKQKGANSTQPGQLGLDQWYVRVTHQMINRSCWWLGARLQ